MNLTLSASDIAFREEVRAFLAEHLTSELRAAALRNTGTFCDFQALERWHSILHEKGWVAPGWPPEHGGPGWNDVQRYVFAAECTAAGTPGHFSFGTLMCGPVLMRFGTENQKSYYLSRILSGEHRWCQGYSEPGAGSDLASLQTRAIADGGDYVVTGTKIWTTFAHHANQIFCLVRTNASGRPQAGISFLLIDMASPGISIKPIVNIAGDHEFNQVFFDDVRVPRENLVGNEGEGWEVAKCLLEFERGSAYAPRLWAQLAWAKHLGRAHGLEDAAFAVKVAEAETDLMALDMLERRVMSALSLGQAPGTQASMLKLLGSEIIQRVDELALEAIGIHAVPYELASLEPGANETAIGHQDALVTVARYLYDRSVTIFGGTSEIQRNILARGILGI
jgi:acyl-CoA dehydrogenase